MDFHKLVDHLKAALDPQDIREMVDRDKENQSIDERSTCPYGQVPAHL